MQDGDRAEVRTFGARDFSALTAMAAGAERLRANLNVHTSLDANVQRLFIATEPGTYMRPHRHAERHKWEFFVVLRGRLDLLVFSDAGDVRRRVVMSPETTPAVEVPPGVFHAYVCMRSGTVGLEVKEGAYLPTQEHDFAPWSPPERSAGAPAYLEWLRAAQPAA
ncbi:MAG TPA: WbuC family cupin fold metalloprotein [Gammaproteobacteria bacterium]|nr:WbuC family cupin fold metalloprotein [Gammaproteobacteria bacterium]